MANTYSPTWFDIFMKTIDPEKTRSEVAFLSKQLPQPEYSRIIDLCCGTGRHAHLLARSGYEILGIDNNNEVLELARINARADGYANEKYLLLDVRDINKLTGCYDALICMWQSFDSFEREVNRGILKQVNNILRNGGRLILELYNKAYFTQAGQQGFYEYERAGRLITACQELRGDRLKVRLVYDKVESHKDEFEWELYSPGELNTLMRDFGFEQIVICSDFDVNVQASGEKARMQCVFEKI